jgi:predicted nucleic acid-binding protein
MSGNKFVLDTNFVLYLLEGKFSLSHFPNGEYFISFITELELLSYPLLKSEDRIKIGNFLSSVYIVDVTSSIKKKTIELRKEYKMKLPDAIIAATSWDMEAKLVSSGKAFSKIKEVMLLSPLK